MFFIYKFYASKTINKSYCICIFNAYIGKIIDSFALFKLINVTAAKRRIVDFMSIFVIWFFCQSQYVYTYKSYLVAGYCWTFEKLYIGFNF